MSAADSESWPLRFARAGSEVVATDASASMLAEAAERAGDAPVQWVTVEAERIGERFANKRFDLVLCHNVLGYIADPARSCLALASLLADGGNLSITVLNRLAEPLRHAFLLRDLDAALAAAEHNNQSRVVAKANGYRSAGIRDRSPRRACEDWPVVVRQHRSEDYEAVKHIYTEAFRRPENPDSIPLEVPLFEALWEAGDALAEFSFTAQTESAAVGHVTASKATVASDPVVAVGPVGVLPEHQRQGIGSALMEALLAAADAAHVPLIVLLGSPQFYSRFGFRPAEQLGVTPPEAGWGDAFQARPLSAYTPRVAGPFRYAPAFTP